MSEDNVETPKHVTDDSRVISDQLTNNEQPNEIMQETREVLTEQSVDPAVEVSRVAFKPPPFWKSNPELWFGQIESQFYTARITSDVTKYHCVITALESDVLIFVSDLIRTPPTVNKYQTLKDRIIKHFAQSETVRLRSLLQDLQLGDKRPTQLLCEMRDLASTNVKEDVLRTLWMQRLPVHCQQILSASTVQLEELAQLADKVVEVSGLTPFVSEVNKTANSQISADVNALQTLQNKVDILEASVERLSRPKYRNSNFGKRGRSRDRTRSSSNKPFCWYHFKFRERARKCVQPCTFKNDYNSEN